MILLHCYGKQVVQITEETLLGAVATFHLRDSICGSFSSQSPKPHLLADSCNTPIIAFPVFMFSSWSRKYDRFCIFPNISPQMLVNPLAFKGPQNLSFCWQQEYRLFFFHPYVDVIYWHCGLSKITVIFHIILNRQTFVSKIWTKLMKEKINHWVQFQLFPLLWKWWILSDLKKYYLK